MENYLADGKNIMKKPLSFYQPTMQIPDTTSGFDISNSLLIENEVFPGFRKPGDAFGDKPLMQNLYDTQKFSQSVEPLKAQKAEEDIRRNQFRGNMLMALGDALRGKDISSGFLQRQQSFQQQAEKRIAEEQRNRILAGYPDDERKVFAEAEAFGGPAAGYKALQNFRDSQFKTNDGTSLMQNVNYLAGLRERYDGMTDEEKKSSEGLLLARTIQDFEGLGGVLRYDPETEFDKNRAGQAGKQGRDFGEGPLTTGQIATDKNFANFYKDYLSKGRGAKNVANVERLDDAKEIMKYAAKNGIAISSVPFSLVAQRPSLSAFFSPEGVMAQERVASVIQQSLKEILGGQFAEREGIALIQRGYNPALSPEENLERLLDLEAQVKQIVESEQDAVEYYENNKNSLAGYKGKRYTAEDFVRDLRKDYTMDIIDLSDQDIEDAYLSAGDGSIWMETLEKEITRRADKRR
jgi:hypothetical protein